MKMLENHHLLKKLLYMSLFLLYIKLKTNIWTEEFKKLEWRTRPVNCDDVHKFIICKLRLVCGLVQFLDAIVFREIGCLPIF